MVLTFPQFCQTLEKGELQLDELQSRYLGHRSKRHTRNFKDPQTVIGEYNGHDKCWLSGPDNAELPVCDKCQSASIRLNKFKKLVILNTVLLKIWCMQSCSDIKDFVKSNFYHDVRIWRMRTCFMISVKIIKICILFI